MALIFVPQYELDFDTTSGSDITWKLEFLRSYAEGTTPTWFVNGSAPPITPLIGTSSPIKIEYERDYDIYKPIQGSSASISLLVQEAAQYLDFNDFGRFDWQVRLRYEDDMGAFQPFWCGFISPIDGKETVSTFPFPVSYTALDGLGQLEEATVPPVGDTTTSIYNDLNDVSLVTVIMFALEQTGLGLDLYIDSGIQDSTGDALVNAVANAYSFYEDTERTSLITLKAALEGILATFNCKITQANGRWYIYNASSLEDSTTWHVYNAQGVAQTDVVESLVYTIDGTSTQDLVASQSDLALNTRRPYGSVECKPSMVESEIVENGGFELEDEGWAAGNRALVFSDTIRLEGERSIVTNYNTFAWDDGGAGETWFVSEDGYQIDSGASISINVDWLGEVLIDSGSNGVRNVRLAYQIYFVPDAVDVPAIFSNLGNISLSTNPYTTGALGALFWDFETNEWRTSFSVNSTNWYRELLAEGSDIGEWLNDSQTIDGPYMQDESDGTYGAAPAGKLYIKFLHPRGQRPVGNGKNRYRGNGNDRLRAYVDNIGIRNVFESDITDPTFERVQADYTSTYTYQPLFGSSTTPFLVQTLAEKNYNRTDKTETRSLEEIGTQQKLNDFRGQFKYYEGTLVNLTDTPLSNINKIKLSWSAVNYIETAAGIMNGGTFDVKNNMFDTSFYIPNQLLDIAPGAFDSTTRVGFSTRNVDLVASNFPGRSSSVAYVLEIQTTTTDDGGVEVVNGLVPVQPFVLFTGEPNQMVTRNITFTPATGFIGVAGSTVVAPDTSSTSTGEYVPGATPRPFHATFPTSFTNTQGDLVLPVTVQMPERSESEILYVNGSVIAFTPESVPGTVVSTVVVSNAGTNLAGDASTTYNVSGVPGSTVHFTHHIRPATNFQLFAGNFDAVYTDNSLTNQDAVDGINNVSIDFAYSIPTTGESVTVSVTGNATAAGTIGVDLFTRTVNFGIAPTNTLFHEASNIFTGVPGSTHDYSITLIPDDDFQITSVAAPTLPSGIVANGAPYQAGENWEIPIQVTIGAASDTLTITQGTIAVSEEPYSLTFNVNNIGISNATIASDDAVHRITFDETDFGDSIDSFVININPVENHMFNATTDVAIDINESSVVISDGSTISLPEDQFAAAIMVVSGAIQIAISGNFPSTGGQYALDINIVGNNNEGGAIEAPATEATAVATSSTVIAHDTMDRFGFTVTADGGWTIPGVDSNGVVQVGGVTTTFMPFVGGSGTTDIVVTFTGGDGVIQQFNNVAIVPNAGTAFNLDTIRFDLYQSIVTQAQYDSVQSGSIPDNVKNAMFYITD